MAGSEPKNNQTISFPSLRFHFTKQIKDNMARANPGDYNVADLNDGIQQLVLRNGNDEDGNLPNAVPQGFARLTAAQARAHQERENFLKRELIKVVMDQNDMQDHEFPRTSKPGDGKPISRVVINPDTGAVSRRGPLMRFMTSLENASNALTNQFTTDEIEMFAFACSKTSVSKMLALSTCFMEFLRAERCITIASRETESVKLATDRSRFYAAPKTGNTPTAGYDSLDEETLLRAWADALQTGAAEGAGEDDL